jgi:hypothetical protein
LASAKEENVEIHQTLDQTLLELNNLWGLYTHLGYSCHLNPIKLMLPASQGPLSLSLVGSKIRRTLEWAGPLSLLGNRTFLSVRATGPGCWVQWEEVDQAVWSRGTWQGWGTAIWGAALFQQATGPGKTL